MTTDIKAPIFPESVADGTIATWHKQPGEAVSRDELIVDIETDKVVLEIVAPSDGTISEIVRGEGETVLSDELIGRFEAGAIAATAVADASPAVVEAVAAIGDIKISPAARKLIDENKLIADNIKASGKGGLITKEDVVSHISNVPVEVPSAPAAEAVAIVEVDAGERIEKRVPMTRLRKRIAERLLEATQSTAMLTTFNEVDMGPVMELRKQYKDLFEKTHNGVRLGFMGFFVRLLVRH